MNMEVDSPVLENVSAEVTATPLPKNETMEAADCEPQPVKEESRVEDDAGAEARVNGNGVEASSTNTIAPAPNAPVLKSPAKDEAPKHLKRRASRSPSLEGEEFRGFAKEESIQDKSAVYTSLVDLMSAELKDEEAKFTPLRRIAALRSVKRLRTEEGSRPSSALSHRSEGDSLMSSPAGGRGRRTAPVTLSLPQYRVPIEHGWKRELVFRATLDVHQRRNADIYYYTPAGKKLRSTREVSEHLAGTGLTLDNFTFTKEPLGLDDPEKEIIRDAKQRDSPASSPAPAPPVSVEGKRVPKPKAPKGASPIHSPTLTPLKLKVKSQGSRLSGRVSTGEKISTPTTPTVKKIRLAVPPPPPLLSRPVPAQPTQQPQGEPCSMRCPGAQNQVPSLACTACLCLYHPACAGHTGPVADNFLCKNCRANSGPPPLMHKPVSRPPPLTPSPRALVHPHSPRPVVIRRYPVPRPVAVRKVRPGNANPRMVAQGSLPSPVTSAPAPPRVFLRMKAAGTQGGTGERIWAVQPGPGASPPPSLTPAPALRSPQNAAPRIALPAPAKVVLPTKSASTSAGPTKAPGTAGPVRVVAPAKTAISKSIPSPRMPNVVSAQRAPMVVSPQITPKVSSPQITPKLASSQGTPKVASPQIPPKLTSPQITPKLTSQKVTPKLASQQVTSKLASPQGTPKLASPQRTSKLASPLRVPGGVTQTQIRPARGTVVQTIAVINGRKYVVVPKQQMPAGAQ